MAKPCNAAALLLALVLCAGGLPKSLAKESLGDLCNHKMLNRALQQRADAGKNVVIVASNGEEKFSQSFRLQMFLFWRRKNIGLFWCEV